MSQMFQDFKNRKTRPELLDKLPRYQGALYAIDLISQFMPFCKEESKLYDYIEMCRDFALNKYNGFIDKRIKNYLTEKLTQTYNYTTNPAKQSCIFASHIVATETFQVSSVVESSESIFLSCFPAAILYDQTQCEVPFPEHYRTPDTLGLAKEICENEDFTLMPVLADALMDLGAYNTDLVRHGKGLSNWALYHLWSY